jgi:ankyrin repeat protein
MNKKRKLLVIALAVTVVLATIFLGSFYIIKNKISIYLENLVEKNPIYFAAAGGNLQEVDRLINEGANPNAKGLNGHTPLIAATRGHHSLIAEHLLLAAANPDQKDNFGWAALHHAITPADGADLDLISILVKHGANVNIQDNRLRTPLHRAAEYGQLQAVLLLLKYGADPNIKDYNGWTPADRAALHPEIQSLLMKNFKK